MFFKSKVFVACLAITSLTAFGIGCGDDDDDNGNGGGAFTSVEGSAEVGSLSADDATQLCEDTESYQKSKAPSNAKAKSCDLMGQAMAGFAYSTSEDLDAAKSACAEARDECLEDDSNEEPGETEDSCENFALPETCTATVEEYVACQQDQLAANLEMFNSIPSCDDLTEEDFAEGEDETAGDTTPESCKTYNAKCAPAQ